MLRSGTFLGHLVIRPQDGHQPQGKRQQREQRKQGRGAVVVRRTAGERVHRGDGRVREHDDDVGAAEGDTAALRGDVGAGGEGGVVRVDGGGGGSVCRRCEGEGDAGHEDTAAVEPVHLRDEWGEGNRSL